MVPKPNSGNSNAMQSISLISPTLVDQYQWNLSPELEAIAREELKETPEKREKGLKTMRKRIAEWPELTKCPTDSVFLLRFLRSQKFDVDKSMKVLERFIQMRDENPDWFKKLDPTDPHIAELVESGFVFVLPKRDAKGRRVIVNNSTNVDVLRHTNSDIMRVFMATFETLMADEENTIRGLTYVFYAKGVTLAHVQIWSPSDAAKIFGTCEKNLAIRHRDINLVNLPFGVWAIVEFLKSLLSSKIRNRISTHSDLVKVAKKLGIDSVPVELGGTADLSMAVMAKAWSQALLENRDYLLGLDEIGLMTEDLSLKEDSTSENKPAPSYWSYLVGGK